MRRREFEELCKNIFGYDARVLYCTTENISKYAGSKKRKLLLVLKEYR